MAKAVRTVKMDSRKFLGVLNDSAQSKVAFFESRIQEMGRSAKKNWRLVALKAKELYFEDTGSNEYYIAEHSKFGRKIQITNIRPIEVVEEEKSDIFNESCYKLINSIEENDQRGMSAAFNRMKSQRFSGRAVPHSGYVRCKDNVLRKVKISGGGNFNESVRARLVSTIVESLRDNVLVEDGQVVSGIFNDGAEVRLPVTKWASRKLVARRMAEAAKDAYWSAGFQKRILTAANLVSEGKIEQAVRGLVPFLEENEEFTLLTRSQTQQLIENTLAANAVFNQDVCNDTATLFHRTNMRLSKGKIVKEWRNIARKAEHAVLAENVQILAESKNFEAAYDKFLSLIFEAISNREVAAEALATTLQALRNKTPKIKESHELSSKLDGLINRLKESKFDDAAIYEAEDLIATIQEELSAAETLGNFDQMPGGSDDSLSDLADTTDTGSGAPVININSPLIQIGGSSGAADKEDDLGLGDLEDEDLDLGGEDEEDDDLASLLDDETAGAGEAGGLGGAGLGAGAGAAGAGAAGAGAAGAGGLGAGLGESRRARRSLNESRPNHYEMKDEFDDDSAHGSDGPFDDDDPYAVKEDRLKLSNTLIRDYGAPVITDANQLRMVANIMHRLAEEHSLSGQNLQENLESMAEAGIKAIGLRIPSGRLPKAIEEAILEFESEKHHFPAGSSSPADDNFMDFGDDEDDEEEGVAEDQYHHPRRPARGYGRSSINRVKIEWKAQQSDAMLGEMANVPFVFDHGGANSNLKPVILSEDGAVEIPIPKHLYDSAFAAANMAQADDKPFLEWLSQHLEQLRPISEGEDAAIKEAMAKITTGPDGRLEVEVSDDVGLDDEMGGDDEFGDEMGIDGINDEGMDDEFDGDEFDGGDEIGGDELGGEMDVDGIADETDEDGIGMEPVDSIIPSGEEDAEEDDDTMPDFEEDEEEGEEEGEEDEDEGMFEDNDMTEPKSAKYAKHAKENKRDMPKPKLPKDSDDKLEKIGPDLKKDNGTGTKPPTAKPMSHS